MSEALNNWLMPQPPLIFHRTGFDVCYGADNSSARPVPQGDLVYTGEGYGVVLRAGAHIGHAALYAASVSRTGHTPVWMQSYKGIMVANTQTYDREPELTAEQRTAIAGRFATVITKDIEQAAVTLLTTNDRLLIGAEAIRLHDLFVEAPSLRDGAGMRGRYIDTKKTP